MNVKKHIRYFWYVDSEKREKLYRAREKDNCMIVRLDSFKYLPDYVCERRGINPYRWLRDIRGASVDLCRRGEEKTYIVKTKKDGREHFIFECEKNDQAVLDEYYIIECENAIPHQVRNHQAIKRWMGSKIGKRRCYV